MIRWRCHRRACARRANPKSKTGPRRSTLEKFPVPKCPRCRKLMTIDHYRTTRREKRRGNCYCGIPKFKPGAPHQRNYCLKLERRQYDES